MLSANFIACSQSSDTNTEPEDDTVYALVNIPFEKFFEKETKDGNFDAYTSATQKAANGSMSYGTYYEEATEITDQSPAFDITITGRGASTIRYSGKQNSWRT